MATDHVWAAEKRKTAQKNGKITADEYEQVSFDSAGNYLKKKQSADGAVSTDFKRLPKIQSGTALQAEADAKGMKKGGKVSSASSRADGCAMRGKTKGRMV
jgi:hypothetical protein